MPAFDPSSPGPALADRLRRLDAHGKQAARIQHREHFAFAVGGQRPLGALARCGTSVVNKLRHGIPPSSADVVTRWVIHLNYLSIKTSLVSAVFSGEFSCERR